jgi:hypothetical protein
VGLNCNLASARLFVTHDGPINAGDEWELIQAGSLSRGPLALPSLAPNLEWQIIQSSTSLKIKANPVSQKCRPMIEAATDSSIDAYVGDPVTLPMQVAGTVTSLRWYKDGMPISNDSLYSGATTSTLNMSSVAPVNLARYHLVANGPCGQTVSHSVDVSVRCGGDFNRDLIVDGEDVIDFFTLWDVGDYRSDWNHDQSVDGDDVIGFFDRWDRGC